MKPHSALIGPHLQAFFSEYLCNHKRASPQTIASCRDTFRLLLQFLKKATGIEPAAIKIGDIDASAVLTFLDSLEQERGNSVRSRNIRLAPPFGPSFGSSHCGTPTASASPHAFSLYR